MSPSKKPKKPKKKKQIADIPEDVKLKAVAVIEQFNKEYLQRSDRFYVPRFEGQYLMLDRSDHGRVGPICRLTWTGDFDDWDFAIFRWSIEIYDPEEDYFPGVQFVDGTIEGAMRAGMEAYPF